MKFALDSQQHQLCVARPRQRGPADFGLRRVNRQAQLEAFGRFVQSVEVLDFDLQAADHAARIRLQLEAAGTPIGAADLLIAATARRHGCTLVTHNTRQFSRVPDLLWEDWY